MQIDVIASLLSGRLVRERIGPAMLSAVQSQVINFSMEEILAICSCRRQEYAEAYFSSSNLCNFQFC